MKFHVFQISGNPPLPFFKNGESIGNVRVQAPIFLEVPTISKKKAYVINFRGYTLWLFNIAMENGP